MKKFQRSSYFLAYRYNIILVVYIISTTTYSMKKFQRSSYFHAALPDVSSMCFISICEGGIIGMDFNGLLLIADFLSQPPLIFFSFFLMKQEGFDPLLEFY
jgi:hypothetical protein